MIPAKENTVNGACFCGRENNGFIHWLLKLLLRYDVYYFSFPTDQSKSHDQAWRQWEERNTPSIDRDPVEKSKVKNGSKYVWIRQSTISSNSRFLSPPHQAVLHFTVNKQPSGSKLITFRIFPSGRNLSPWNRHLAFVNNLILATLETSPLFITFVFWRQNKL